MNNEKRLRDLVVVSAPENVPKHLEQISAWFEMIADQIGNKAFLGEGAQVFPNMLRCIARQLKILRASYDLPIEVAASACRIVFELNIRTKLMTSYPERIKEFLVERVFEEISIIEAFMRLTNADTAPQTLAPLNARIAELRRIIDKYKLSRPTSLSTFKMAEVVGVADEFKALYGFYSKYTHGTGWLVNSKEEQRDGQDFRNIFLVKTQIYAGDALKRIADFVHIELPPL